MSDRIWIKDTPAHIGETVTVKGWVHGRRDHGKLIFIDLRDRSGLLQVVFYKSSDEDMLFKEANHLRTEYVVSLTGVINKRNERQQNAEMVTGLVEMSVEKLVILNEAETPVFEIDKAHEAGEEIRMKYRYLDMRSERMQENIRKRHEVVNLVRNYFVNNEFYEVETPYLTKGTPEGAREFIVPARLSPGKFYVLPQSPQQFKQLLMSGGVERYFQIARCFRDEDTRGDRQAEFTQMDMEMSFTDQEEVMNLNEKILIEIVEKLYPEKRIQEVPFPRISYEESMKTYGSDRPDIRTDKDDSNLLAFCWVVDFPMFEKTKKDENYDNMTSEWTFTHNPFSAPIPEHLPLLERKETIGDITSSQYDIVLNGYEIGGGSIRNHRSQLLKTTLEIIGHSEEDIKNNFGHLLEAFDSGTPPHGGIAWGLERLLMVLQNEPSIRDVMAFPKTGDSNDLLMGAPSALPAQKIKDTGLTV